KSRLEIKTQLASEDAQSADAGAIVFLGAVLENVTHQIQILLHENIPLGSRKNRLAFWREHRAGRCKAPRRRRCGDIVKERQRRRCPPAAAPRRAAAPRPSKTIAVSQL